MTAQFPDFLQYNDKSYMLFANPLEAYFTQTGHRPDFDPSGRGGTALMRGYVAVWRIENGRLYLVSLHARLKDGTNATVQRLFPECGDRVFAEWYTGTLRCPFGECIKYVHVDYETRLESELLIHVENGIVTGDELITHEPEPDTGERYSIPAFLQRTGNKE